MPPFPTTWRQGRVCHLSQKRHRIPWRKVSAESCFGVSGSSVMCLWYVISDNSCVIIRPLHGQQPLWMKWGDSHCIEHGCPHRHNSPKYKSLTTRQGLRVFQTQRLDGVSNLPWVIRYNPPTVTQQGLGLWKNTDQPTNQQYNSVTNAMSFSSVWLTSPIEILMCLQLRTEPVTRTWLSLWNKMLSWAVPWPHPQYPRATTVWGMVRASSSPRRTPGDVCGEHRGVSPMSSCLEDRGQQ